MKESWRALNEHYDISSYGRLRSWILSSKGSVMRTKPLILRLQKNKAGYLRFKINDKKQRVHRLVAKAFIPNWDNKPNINHIDAVKDNNRVNNLEWCTQKENNIHTARLGRAPRKLSNTQVKSIYKSKESTSSLAAKHSVSTTTVLEIKRGDTWSWLNGV